MRQIIAKVVTAGLVMMQLASAHAEDAPLVIEQKPADLAAVSNLDELKKQPKIVINGITTQLGIQATTCPAGTGLLVYCLWDAKDYKPARSTHVDTLNLLGPFELHVSKVEGPKLALSRNKGTKAEATRLPIGPAVSITGAIIAAVGKYTVEVLDANGQVVARCMVEGMENKDPTWLPVYFANAQWDKTYTRFKADMKLDMEPQVPTWSDWTSTSKGLPTFIPAKPDENMVLKAENGILLLTMKPEELNPMDYHFAARWWVNGKPFQVATPTETKGRSFTGQVLKPKTDIQMSLDLGNMAEVLHAKAADMIEVEFLYSAIDFMPAVDYDLAMKMALTQPTGALPVRLSNRIKWTIPAINK